MLYPYKLDWIVNIYSQKDTQNQKRCENQHDQCTSWESEYEVIAVLDGFQITWKYNGIS